MTDVEKAPYVQLAMQDKQRYDAELAEWRAFAATSGAGAASALGGATSGAAITMALPRAGGEYRDDDIVLLSLRNCMPCVLCCAVLCRRRKWP